MLILFPYTYIICETFATGKQAYLIESTFLYEKMSTEKKIIEINKTFLKSYNNKCIFIHYNSLGNTEYSYTTVVRATPSTVLH